MELVVPVGFRVVTLVLGLLMVLFLVMTVGFFVLAAFSPVATEAIIISTVQFLIVGAIVEFLTWAGASS